MTAKPPPRKQPSRAVTCATCRKRFAPARSDARYCSAACRQKAARARGQLIDLDRRIEAARLLYWRLVREKAQALGVEVGFGVMTGESQEVDDQGHVTMHGKIVGKTTPARKGWTVYGLEAAGAPYSPPLAPKVLAEELGRLTRRAKR